MEEKVEDMGDLAPGALLGEGVLSGEAGLAFPSVLPLFDFQEKFLLYFYSKLSFPTGAGAEGGEVLATGA